MAFQLWLFFFGLTVVFAQLPQARKTFSQNRTNCFNSEDFRFPDQVPEFVQQNLQQLIPEVCVNFEFDFCTSSPHLHLNLIVDGELMVNQDINDESEICQDTTNQCQPCVGFKKGSLVVGPNYAEVCPEYRMYCDVPVLGKIQIAPETAFEIPCYDFGVSCTANTKESCLSILGCGWCNGNGIGLEYNNADSDPGTGCTPMRPKNPPLRGATFEDLEFRPICSDCPPDQFYVQDEASKEEKDQPNRVARLRRIFGQNRNNCFNPEDFRFPDQVPKIVQQNLRQRMPEICVNFEFDFCTSSPRIHLNLTVDGEVMINQDINDESEFCQFPTNPTNPCQPCVGIKKGSLVVRPNYAKVCPAYKMYCDFPVLGKMEVDPGMEVPCFDFGVPCNASTMESCLSTRGCGWCNGNGIGREYDDTDSDPGTGCVSMRPKNPRLRNATFEDLEFRPICSDCPPDQFYIKREASKAASKAESTGEWVKDHPGQFAGIIIGSTLGILTMVSIFCFCILNQKNFVRNYTVQMQQTDDVQKA